ncbi:MAG: hypothetical protein AB1641_27335, partial [Thermodesulfobacteriota bacterium]
VENRLFTRRERAVPLPPLEVNSSGSTLTPGRGLIALGLMTDLLQVRQACASDKERIDEFK